MTVGASLRRLRCRMGLHADTWWIYDWPVALELDPRETASDVNLSPNAINRMVNPPMTSRSRIIRVCVRCGSRR